MRFRRRREGLRINDRRRRKPSEKIQFGVNLAASMLLGVPMIIEPLKEDMPPHFYGVTSSVVAVLNLAIGCYRLYINRGEGRVRL